jgi:hypothetical protein
VLAFDELDRLIFAQAWPQEGGQFPPLTVAQALIDSGGTSDNLLDASRTQQVYNYALARQPIIRAIKGANKPGIGLYWPMKNPMASGLTKAERAEQGTPSLAALMVDKHRCNDLLANFIAAGVPRADGKPASEETEPEQWLLNKRDDPEYNLQMSNMQKTMDPLTKQEIWTPRAQGSRHDYRDCEAYMIALAYMANVHLLPEETEVMQWKAQLQRQPEPPAPREQPGGGDDWSPRPL